VIHVSEHITVATANTFFGSMLNAPEGMTVLSNAAVDVVLMQEVLNMSSEQVNDSILPQGYALQAIDNDSGLAIAVRNESRIVVTGSRCERIEPISRVGSFALEHGLPQAQRLRSRAYLSASLRMPSGGQVDVATTRPTVFVRPVARNRQLKVIARLINENRTRGVPFILGADMNHYPGPRKADRKLADDAGLCRAELHAPTWLAVGSKHEWIATIGVLAIGRPLGTFDAQLDAILFSDDLQLDRSDITDIPSDHKTILCRFILRK
jgi:endonuclease/exonuclease/phosphatase family metal-dependent hydrolase